MFEKYLKHIIHQKRRNRVADWLTKNYVSVAEFEDAILGHLTDYETFARFGERAGSNFVNASILHGAIEDEKNNGQQITKCVDKF